MRNQSVDLPQVLGTGVLYNGTSNPFCLVSSACEPGRAHVVKYLPRGRFACDCKGYTYCGHCRHIDAVVTLLERVRNSEYAEREEPAVRASEDVDVVSHARLAAPASREACRACSHPGDTAMLRRSNKPFSILK